jgi:prolyl-tRNA synthetase
VYEASLLTLTENKNIDKISEERKIFGPTKEEVIGEWSKVHVKKHSNLLPLLLA